MAVTPSRSIRSIAAHFHSISAARDSRGCRATTSISARLSCRLMWLTRPTILGPERAMRQNARCAKPNTKHHDEGDDAALKIVLDGTGLTANPRSFDLESGSDNSMIRGFVIT